VGATLAGRQRPDGKPTSVQVPGGVKILLNRVMGVFPSLRRLSRLLRYRF
jgi:hypothetical protein